MKQNLKYFLIIFVFALLIARPAYAYLDPGTGSMLLQILAAIAIAIGVSWRSFAAFIRRKKNKNKVEDADNKENAPDGDEAYDKHLAD